jgi:hypothetical protein
MLSKSKKCRGFLKPEKIPFSRKKRKPADLSVCSDYTDLPDCISTVFAAAECFDVVLLPQTRILQGGLR